FVPALAGAQVIQMRVAPAGRQTSHDLFVLFWAEKRASAGAGYRRLSLAVGLEAPSWSQIYGNYGVFRPTIIPRTLDFRGSRHPSHRCGLKFGRQDSPC